jgi:nitrogen PTS system EIIA component
MFSLHPEPSPRAATPAPATTRNARRDTLIDLLSVEDILLDVDAPTPERVFRCIAASIGARHGLHEPDVVAALTEREHLGSTALGHGVAIPHCRLPGLTRAIAGFVRLRPAIDFDAPDAKPVSTLLVLLVPELATDAHLELLAEAANKLSGQPLRDKLGRCVVPAEILEAFSS